MKFGDTVYVLRGNAGNYPREPGCLRVVRCRLMGRQAGTSTVRLMQRDRLAMNYYPGQDGKVKTFDSSTVFGTRTAANKAKARELKEYMNDDYDVDYWF
jgi:hypothetical protein